MKHHIIRSDVRVPLIWNDDENRFEVDTASIPADFSLAFVQGVHDPDCPCREATEGGITSQEHDEQWARAVAADMPTATELGLGLRGDVRPVNKILENMILDVLDDAAGLLTPVEKGNVLAGLLPLFTSVDANAQARGEQIGRRSVTA